VPIGCGENRGHLTFSALAKLARIERLGSEALSELSVCFRITRLGTIRYILDNLGRVFSRTSAVTRKC
jgi:hypothetical protein